MENESSAIIVQLRVPQMSPAELGGLPAANFIATRILLKAFELGFQLAGVKPDTAIAWGELNASNYVFEVWEMQSALKSIQATLKPLELLPFCTIHYFDDREEIMRLLTKGVGMNYEELSDLVAFREGNKAAMEVERARQLSLRLISNPFLAPVFWPILKWKIHRAKKAHKAVNK